VVDPSTSTGFANTIVAISLSVLIYTFGVTVISNNASAEPIGVILLVMDTLSLVPVNITPVSK
jgi:hypothetical protein